MKQQLTEAQFQASTKDVEVGRRTIESAHGVLVAGLQQARFVKSLGLSEGAVSHRR